MRVFISSTFGDLAAERLSLKEMIEQEFPGSRAFCYELDPGPPLAGLASSLKELDRSDCCVALFKVSYGTIIDTELVSFTIREVWHAFATRKPTFVYIQPPCSALRPAEWMAHGAGSRDPLLELALLPITDPHIGRHWTYFYSTDSLKQLVRAQLREWESSGCPPGQPLYVTQCLLEFPGHRRDPETQDPVFSYVPRTGFSTPRSAEEGVAELHAYLRRDDPVCLQHACRQMLYALPRVRLRLAVTRNTKEWLRVWASFLGLFKWAQNGMKESDGAWGSISLAKAILQISEALEDSASYAGALEGLAGCYYSAGRYAESLRWYELATHMTNSPAHASTRASVLGNKARVLAAQGDPTREPVNLAYRALALGANDEKLQGLTRGFLAGRYLRAGREGGALRLLGDACAILRDSPMSLIRVRRDWACALAAIGELDAARQLVLSITAAAKERGYRHQLWRIATSPEFSPLRPLLGTHLS